MTESVSVPKNEQVDPYKHISGWETVLRCVVLLFGILLGLVVAVMIAGAIGWFRIDC
jgi:hypothetical protein